MEEGGERLAHYNGQTTNSYCLLVLECNTHQVRLFLPITLRNENSYFAVQTAKIFDEGPKNAGFQPPTSILQTCVQLTAEIGAFTLNVDIAAVEEEGRVFLLVMATLRMQTSFNPCFTRIS